MEERVSTRVNVKNRVDTVIVCDACFDRSFNRPVAWKGAEEVGKKRWLRMLRAMQCRAR